MYSLVRFVLILSLAYQLQDFFIVLDDYGVASIKKSNNNNMNKSDNKKKHSNNNHNNNLCSLQQLIDGKFIPVLHENGPPYIPMRGEKIDRTCAMATIVTPTTTGTLQTTITTGSNNSSNYDNDEFQSLEQLQLQLESQQLQLQQIPFEEIRKKQQLQAQQQLEQQVQAAQQPQAHLQPPQQLEPWLTWEWMPSAVTRKECIYHSRFDPTLFCSLVKNKTILILGDSISLDHYLSLTDWLGVPKQLPRVLRNPTLISHVCNGTATTTTKIISKKDFTLKLLETMLQSYRPDIVVLNRGSHYVPDHELLQDMQSLVLRPIQDWYQSHCKKDFPNHHDDENNQNSCLLIWRTTVPGHPHCTNYTQPAQSVSEMEHLIASNPVHDWEKFQKQNQLVRQLLQNHTVSTATTSSTTTTTTTTDTTMANNNDNNNNNFQWKIMDFYPLQILRPDLHSHKQQNGDCLHNCLPNDNLFTELFQHMVYLEFGKQNT